MFGQHLDYFAVAVRERNGRPGQVRRDQGEHLDDLGIESIQLTLERLPLLRHSQTLPPSVAVAELGRHSTAVCLGHALSSGLAIVLATILALILDSLCTFHRSPTPSSV